MSRIGSYDRAVGWAAVAGAAALLALSAPTPVVGQETTPTRVEITRLDVPAHQMQAFQEAVGLLVEAATAAEMGEEFTWWFHQGNGYFTVVSPVESMAQFDDPDAFLRAMKGTPGEAKLEAFTSAVQEIDYRANTQVAMAVEDWSYRPEAGLSIEESSLVHVFSFRVRPGMEEALNANIAAWKTAMADVGFPYPMEGYRTLLGEGGRGYLVFHADSRADVYGKNDLQVLMTKRGMGAEYDRLVSELLDCISEYQWADEDYLSELSYTPGMS